MPESRLRSTYRNSSDPTPPRPRREKGRPGNASCRVNVGPPILRCNFARSSGMQAAVESGTTSSCAASSFDIAGARPPPFRTCVISMGLKDTLVSGYIDLCFPPPPASKTSCAPHETSTSPLDTATRRTSPPRFHNTHPISAQGRRAATRGTVASRDACWGETDVLSSTRVRALAVRRRAP